MWFRLKRSKNFTHLINLNIIIYTWPGELEIQLLYDGSIQDALLSQ